LADEVEAFFALDLEPHFKAEEALLDFLETRWGGQDPDLVRTRKDHAALRRSAASGRAEEMVRFGEELKAHIQYEEGVLFDRFESSLTPEEAKTWGERFVGVTPSQPSNPLALKR
jgi:hypothetical protein